MDKHTEQLMTTARELRLSMLAVMGIMAAAGIVVILTVWPFTRPLPYILGVAAGGGISALRLRLIAASLKKTMDMDSATAQNMTRLGFTARYFLTAALVGAVVFLRDYVSLAGTLLGILSLQFAAYIVGHLERRRERQRFLEHGYPDPIPYEDDEDDD